MPNLGSHKRGEEESEELRDWLLGGTRKRQILDCLVDPPKGGWSAEALAKHLEAGPATVYETLRVLRGAGLLETPTPRRHQLVSGTDLSDALRLLILLLREEGRSPVNRPPRNRY